MRGMTVNANVYLFAGYMIMNIKPAGSDPGMAAQAGGGFRLPALCSVTLPAPLFVRFVQNISEQAFSFAAVGMVTTEAIPGTGRKILMACLKIRPAVAGKADLVRFIPEQLRET